MKKMTFADGSTLSWESKESLLYEKDKHMVSVWFDFGPGLFSKKRIIKMSSLMRWQTFPQASQEGIDASDVEDIINKIKVFCPKWGIEIEHDE